MTIWLWLKHCIKIKNPGQRHGCSLGDKCRPLYCKDQGYRTSLLRGSRSGEREERYSGTAEHNMKNSGLQVKADSRSAACLPRSPWFSLCPYGHALNLRAFIFKN